MKVAKKHLNNCGVGQIGLTSENAHYEIICWKLCGSWY